ncbi:GNAT family N-acetyltransferase [Streptomyces sp. NBC_01381]|uniref:GNAT family N-acetyltransferase n=1 Tax=Streptomyces sp. NBC_01381 TaxID=2903845 RepID=UPI002255FB8D|nr:GNAT family N-acetyltransferase [Streptomyces sp. NBC_01381]MCX4666562.1 GNAT family N-acetyltransferase [Streptomyces sp. NBC_01381]
MDAELRTASPQDADALLDLQLILDRESTFMLLEPGERETDPSRLRTRLGDKDDPSYTVIAWDGLTAAGYVSVGISPYARARATGHVVTGVAERFTGRGLGRALLQAAREHAVERGLHRLELTVMEHNRRALSLYLGCGYQVEGLRRDVLTVEGEDVSEYYMGLLLAPS